MRSNSNSSDATRRPATHLGNEIVKPPFHGVRFDITVYDLDGLAKDYTNAVLYMDEHGDEVVRFKRALRMLSDKMIRDSRADLPEAISPEEV